MTGQHWLVFLSAAALVAATPGANNLLALGNGMRRGLLPAVLALVGRFSAFAILIAAVVAGLGALLTASAVTFAVVKWLGVGYLIWLGVRLWHSDISPQATAAADGGAMALARREFWVALTNPKAMLLFTAFLPQFVVSAAPLPGQMVRLGAAYIAVEFVAASLYAFAGSRIRALRLGHRGVRRVNRASSAMMLAAAGLLAGVRRSA